MTAEATGGAATERAPGAAHGDDASRRDAVADAAAAIAHEMRNPVLGISSAVQLLRFRSRDDPVVERNVGRILREVEKLNGMINDLVEFGRPRPLILEPGDPSAVWDRVLAGNRGLLESGALQLDRADEAQVRIPIDAERLGQAFLSILLFAVEHAPPGSTLTLRSTSHSGGGWQCRLRHEGPGLSPEEVSRMFDIVHSSRKSGRAIGLALCRRILDQHGGDITLTTAPGEGSTIIVTLPGRSR